MSFDWEVSCFLSKPFHFLGIPGRVIFKFDMAVLILGSVPIFPKTLFNGENLKRLLLWMVGIEPTTQKTMVLPTTPFVKVISGVLVRLTTFEMLTNSLPKLSLVTPCRTSILIIIHTALVRG